MRRYEYYEILEINRNATQEEIKKAYRSLTFKYHPDKNPDPEAHKKLIKINQAYEVLSNPLRRVEYDSSPEECPLCWTYEVVQTAEFSWKCRRCHCQFDSLGTTKIIDEIERAAIPERQRKYMRLFLTTQCSWCKKFYTQPFLCPNELLESNCVPFKRLTEKEREVFLRDEIWWWRMQDMIMRVGERGILGRCRNPKCFALNPNPQKRTCWACGKDTLECPAYLKDGTRCGTLLRYDIEENYWKCIRASCSKRYKYVKEDPVKLSQKVVDEIDELLEEDRKRRQEEEEEKRREQVNWAKCHEARTAHIRQSENIRHKQQVVDEHSQEEDQKRGQQTEVELRRAQEEHTRATEEYKQSEEERIQAEQEKRRQQTEQRKQRVLRAARRKKGLCETCGTPLGFLDKKLVGQTKCKKCRESISEVTAQGKKPAVSGVTCPYCGSKLVRYSPKFKYWICESRKCRGKRIFSGPADNT